MEAALAVAGKYKWLVGKPECLDKHHHDDCYLVVGAVDAHLGYGVGLVGHEIGEQELVDGLVHYPGDAEDEQGNE